MNALRTRLPLAAYLVALLFLFIPMALPAHFQELIPSTEAVTGAAGGSFRLDLRFTHPMQGGPVMEMVRPVRFGVLAPEGREDLGDRLEAVPVDGKTTWRADYRISRPGDHIFFVEPAPYWEPAEGVMIVHYTKVVVDAYGGGEGWDASLGFPVEIRPLTRPYGLWTGNLFTGLVTRGGQPVPFAEVEVEWRNDGSLPPPQDPFVTQVVQADGSGVFSYAMPRAGWWGFAALLEGEAPVRGPDAQEVPVELGALIWVRTRDMR